MKWHPNENAGQYEDGENKNSKENIEQRFRESEQLELFPEESPTILKQVISFLKDLRLSDFD
jgi:hypothetical protein